jgi:hypothetical protein
LVLIPVAGLTEPQAPETVLPQLTAQVTPALALSLSTVAVKFCEPPTVRIAESGSMLTEIVVVVIVSVIDDDWLGFCVEVAVMVRFPLTGITAGAVKLVVAPLAVCAGLNVPQAPAVVVPQVTVQSRPRPLESFTTLALSASCPPVTIEVASP